MATYGYKQTVNLAKVKQNDETGNGWGLYKYLALAAEKSALHNTPWMLAMSSRSGYMITDKMSDVNRVRAWCYYLVNNTHGMTTPKVEYFENPHPWEC